MFDMHRVELDWGGRKLTLETGRVARQADGAVLATYGETTVLAAVVAAKQPKEGIDFLPLTVNYTEKYYAAGRIPGGYFKRERGPTEKDTLTSRLIDRPIRPLFADGWRCDTQVIITVLSHDQENDPDIVAMVAASAALTLSGAPFMGPIGGARVAFVNNEYVLNPTIDEMKESQLDLVVAGTQDDVLMVESEAKELSEEIMLGAVMFGHRHMQPVIQAIIQLAEKAAKEPRDFAQPDTKAVEKEMLGIVEKDLRAAYAIPAKHQRQDAVAAVKKAAMAHFFPDGKDNPERPMLLVAGVFKELEAKIVRWNILDTSKRIDGRDLVTVRPIVVEAPFLPRTHGSALFTRGETQAIVVATLGTGEDEQWIDALTGTYKEAFMLHYNFPPFSVGETGRTGAPGRREIGHGKLAWRAIRPMLPAKDEFPYTIRVVSEITESNGSSSMATVCGGMLALMDAGVPMKGMVAGISIGLVTEAGDDGQLKRYELLTDIIGSEDHYGVMDFKLCGTDTGVTGFQLDLKLPGVGHNIMTEAIQRAKEARTKILEIMRSTLDQPRTELSKYAPRIETIKINPEKIGALIGPGGKTIKGIVAETGAEINIEDDGSVHIYATTGESMARAKEIIGGMTREIEIGTTYQGRVVTTKEFGAFVEVFPGKDGLVHISELADFRVKRTEDVVKIGDMIWVKCIGIDDKGRVKLSRKAALKERAEKETGQAL